jgi:hypothetical protein
MITINHLGMNPLKGGNPPNDKSVIAREVCGIKEGDRVL